MHHRFAAIVTQSEAQPERTTLPVWRQSDGGDDFILLQLMTIDDAPQLRGDRHTVRGAARADYSLEIFQLLFASPFRHLLEVHALFCAARFLGESDGVRTTAR